MAKRPSEHLTDDASIELSDAERQILWEALTMMIQEINREAQRIEDVNRAATLNGQPLDHAPEVIVTLLACASRAYDLRVRLENAIGG